MAWEDFIRRAADAQPVERDAVVGMATEAIRSLTGYGVAPRAAERVARGVVAMVREMDGNPLWQVTDPS